jgi:hypothetical protein
MNRDAHALHVEADRPRRQVRLADDVEAISLRGTDRVNLGEGDRSIAADDGVTI